MLLWEGYGSGGADRPTIVDRVTSIRVTTDPAEIDLDIVHRWLSQDAYWAIGRSRETVERAARGSLNFGALDADGTLVGYARVVTDHVTFAWLCDVKARLAVVAGAEAEADVPETIDSTAP